ncbi:hypothetical protein FUAX_40450 (plasmid) [Fulvitalea axinellae]|uniref:GRAM domain-containing protein n=1 Tax=Fulvitalea axinellae TaxID=1182444 RepID=A0AAU9CU70_9BACT|nr:hypothetical protein FUAX_40450 [Fulvitalea axinellae]
MNNLFGKINWTYLILWAFAFFLEYQVIFYLNKFFHFTNKNEEQLMLVIMLLYLPTIIAVQVFIRFYTPYKSISFKRDENETLKRVLRVQHVRGFGLTPGLLYITNRRVCFVSEDMKGLEIASPNGACTAYNKGILSKISGKEVLRVNLEDNRSYELFIVINQMDHITGLKTAGTSNDSSISIQNLMTYTPKDKGPLRKPKSD